MLPSLRVLTVDDHPVVRQGLRWLLDADGGISVVAEAEDLAGAAAALQAGGVDVVLLDIHLGDDDGLELLRELRRQFPQVPVVMLTMFDDPEYVEQAIAAGARGYLVKDAPRDELIRAIQAAGRGDAYLQPEVTPPLLRRLARSAAAGDRLPDLTPREADVVSLAARGLTNRQIGVELGISEVTVKGYLGHVYDKLGALDRAHAVALAIRNRLID